MAQIYGRLGHIVCLLKSQDDIDRFGDPSEYDDLIEFDPATNAEVIAGLDTDWNSHAIADGKLLRSGKIVTINAPGTELATNAIKSQIIDAAKALAGVKVQDMTTTQLKLLLLVLTYKAGGIDPATLTVKPLGEWVK